MSRMHLQAVERGESECGATDAALADKQTQASQSTDR